MGSNAALVLIDVQKAFEDPSWGPRNNPGAEDQIAILLAAWRARAAPVVHGYHDSQMPGSTLAPGSAGNAPKDVARPEPGEPVYRKVVNSAFIGTSLEADLRQAAIDTVVIVGLTTNHCASTTARMAGNLGFQTIVVSDATATFDRKTVDGTNRRAEDVHAGALSDLNEEFARILDTAAVLKLVQG